MRGKIPARLHQDLLAIFFLCIVVVVFFYKTIFFGLLPIPSDTLIGRYHPWVDALVAEFPRGMPYKNYLISDPVRQQIPWRKLVVESLSSGRKPGWDPHSFGGTPLDLNSQAAPFYPFNILFLWFNFPTAWSLLIISQVVGMMVFTYIFLRVIKRSPQAAMVGALMAGFGGFGIAWLYWGTMLSTLMWLPLLLIAITYLKPHRSRVQKLFWVLVFTFGVFCALTAGHLQIALYVLLLAAAYTLHVSQHARSRLPFLPWVIALPTITILFHSTIFRFIQFLSTTVRASSPTLWQSEGFFIPLKHLIQYIAPDYFGNPGRFNYWSTWNYGELIGYVGMAGLFFGVIGILSVSQKNRFWTRALLVSFLFSLNTPIAWLPYFLKIPFISSLQPTRLLSIIGFTLAILASYGFDWLKANPNRIPQITKPLLVIGGLLTAMGLIALNGWGFPNPEFTTIALRNLVIPTFLFSLLTILLVIWWQAHQRGKKIFTGLTEAAFIGILALDLIYFGHKFLPFTAGQYLYPETQTTQFLQAIEKPFRVMVIDTEVAPTNTLTWYGIEEMGGYNPVYSKRYAHFFQALQNAPYSHELTFQRLFDPNNIYSPLLKFADIEYIISLEPLAAPFLTLSHSEGDTHIYHQENNLGRWYLADQLIVQTESLILDTMMQGTIQGKPSYIEAHALNQNITGQGEIHKLQYSPNYQAIEVSVQSPAFLVNSTPHHSHWRAYIDQKPVPIHHANYLFMGIEIPSGSHLVEFVYE